MQLPLLAKTLREIAATGAAGFYQGWVAEDMANAMPAQGGLHAVEDFARHKRRIRDAHRDRLQGHTLWECPPPGQGLTALLMLNIL